MITTVTGIFFENNKFYYHFIKIIILFIYLSVIETFFPVGKRLRSREQLHINFEETPPPEHLITTTRT